MVKPLRAALYLRTSSNERTVENQRRELEAAAAQRGWVVVTTYADEGISGSKGRDKRPGLDAMLKDAVRGRFDVVMCWAVDRMGRSLADLVGTLQDLHGAKVDLFLHQQAIDTTTPAGRAMFGMMGVFAEFERSMIQARVKAGLERAKASPRPGAKAIGRPKVTAATEAVIRAHLAAGTGKAKVAKLLGVGVSTVQRIAQEGTATTTTTTTTTYEAMMAGRGGPKITVLEKKVDAPRMVAVPINDKGKPPAST